MDPAVASLDLAKAGVIIANMIESYLAGGATLPDPEGADHDALEDCRSSSVAESLHLHSPVDDEPGPLQSGKHRTSIQSGEPSGVARLDAGADPDPRRGSRPLGQAGDPSRRLQDSCQRCGNGSCRCNLLFGSLAPGTLEQGLASAAGAVRGHPHIGIRRRWLLRPSLDSLVLGMKGTFAQAELHIIRARLHGGKLNKAQKGELRFPLPVGLVSDGVGRMAVFGMAS